MATMERGSFWNAPCCAGLVGSIPKEEGRLFWHAEEKYTW